MTQEEVVEIATLLEAMPGGDETLEGIAQVKS
jgi:hypothetical protein